MLPDGPDMNTSKTISIGTDVAAFVLFHPDDLVFASEWPIAWYSMPQIWKRESEARRLVCWQTGGDGGYVIRVTTGALTDRETTYSAASWTFEYEVRHGKVFVDNTDGLPGEEKMIEPSETPDQWVDIDNGNYHVKVTAIEWTAEPDADAKTGTDDELASYVVQFMPAERTSPSIAQRPPDIPSTRGEEATDKFYYATAPDTKIPTPLYPARDEEDLTAILPSVSVDALGPSGGRARTVPKANISHAASQNADRFSLFEVPFVLTTKIEVGAPALIAKAHSKGGAPNELPMIGYKLLGPARIKSIEGCFYNGKIRKLKSGLFSSAPQPQAPYTELLFAVRASPVNPEPFNLSDAASEEMRMSVIKALSTDSLLAKARAGKASYDVIIMQDWIGASAFMRWLISHLPMSATEQLELECMHGNDRYHAIMKKLND